MDAFNFQRPNWSLSPKSCYIEQNETTTNHAQTILISARIWNSTKPQLGNPNALGEPPQGFCCLWWWDAKTRQRPRRPLRRSQIAACAHGGTIGFSFRARKGFGIEDLWFAVLNGKTLFLFSSSSSEDFHQPHSNHPAQKESDFLIQFDSNLPCQVVFENQFFCMTHKLNEGQPSNFCFSPKISGYPFLKLHFP